MAQRVSRLLICFLMVGIAVGGTSVGILLKIMSRIEVNGDRFKHPYFTTFWFFFGQAFWLVIYYIEQCWLRIKYGKDKTQHPKLKVAIDEGRQVHSSPFLFLLPALLDATRNLLFIISITFVPASVSNMMGALVVVVTTLLVSFTFWPHLITLFLNLNYPLRTINSRSAYF